MCKEEKHGIMQPKWIRVQDALPTEDGEYYTIVELQHDSEGFKKGTIDIYRYNDWEDGEWRCEDYWWKVIYWAYPLTIELPTELADRPQWSYETDHNETSHHKAYNNQSNDNKTDYSQRGINGLLFNK